MESIVNEVIQKDDEMNKKIRAVIYARKSPDEDYDTSLSVENQIQKCKDYIGIKDWILIDTYSDKKHSGGSIDRPSYKKMMRDGMSKKFDVIVIFRMDRFSRSVQDYVNLVDGLNYYGIKICIITESIDPYSTMGEAFTLISMVFAQLERRRGKDRTSEVVNHILKDKHRPITKPPLGYSISKSQNWVKDPYNAPKIKRLFEMFSEGFKPVMICSEIKFKFLKIVNKKTRKTKSEYRNISVNSFYKIIQNKTYTGKYFYNGEHILEIKIPALISQDLFSEVNSKIDKTKGRKKAKKTEVEENHSPYMYEMFIRG